VVGVVVFGAIAGSLGAGRVQLIVVSRSSRRSGIASALIERALDVLAAERMRAAFVELPDDPALSAATRLLVRCGFRIEARVADHFRDGIDLAVLRRDLE
jgi:ribosomal protein S18 acetylase RimI-like enzyme